MFDMLSLSTGYSSLAECKIAKGYLFPSVVGKNGLLGSCSKIENLKALGWLAIVFWLPLDIIVLFWMRWEILSVVRSLTKNAVYLPGTAEEQASAQGKREKEFKLV